MKEQEYCVGIILKVHSHGSLYTSWFIYTLNITDVFLYRNIVNISEGSGGCGSGGGGGCVTCVILQSRRYDFSNLTTGDGEFWHNSQSIPEMNQDGHHFFPYSVQSNDN